MSFKSLVQSGVPAGALAEASRNASPAAKRRNPKLKRVKGKSRKQKRVAARGSRKSRR